MIERLYRRWMVMLCLMGPGFLAAMADNDAGGIAMYMQAGAEYGYAVLGVVSLSIICLVICQDMAARMGLASGQGLAALIRQEYGLVSSMLVMVILLVANLATTVTEFIGIAIAGSLLGIADWLSVLLAGIMLCVMALWCCYRRIERILLVLCLSFVAYLIGGYEAMPTLVAVQAHCNLAELWKVPFWLMTIGVIGTTVTPWGQFYLQSSVVDKGLDYESYRYIKADVWIGSCLTGLIALAIVCIGTAAFFEQGKEYISLTQSVDALTRLFGMWAGLLFGMGLLGASLLAAFIVPLSTAYAICESFGMEYGLDHSWREAPVFFAVYVGVIVIGLIGAIAIDIAPLRLIIATQVANGILLLPILACAVMLSQKERVMGRYTSGVWQNRLAIAVLWILTIAQVTMLVTI